MGVPPIIGFFAKQMILSAALDSGYVFMALIAIITSVIGAGYYLNLVKQIFFYEDNYKIDPATNNLSLRVHIPEKKMKKFVANNSIILSKEYKDSLS